MPRVKAQLFCKRSVYDYFNCRLSYTVPLPLSLYMHIIKEFALALGQLLRLISSFLIKSTHKR